MNLSTALLRRHLEAPGSIPALKSASCESPQQSNAAPAFAADNVLRDSFLPAISSWKALDRDHLNKVTISFVFNVYACSCFLLFNRIFEIKRETFVCGDSVCFDVWRDALYASHTVEWTVLWIDGVESTELSRQCRIDEHWSSTNRQCSSRIDTRRVPMAFYRQNAGNADFLFKLSFSFFDKLCWLSRSSIFFVQINKIPRENICWFKNFCNKRNLLNLWSKTFSDEDSSTRQNLSLFSASSVQTNSILSFHLVSRFDSNLEPLS